MLHEIPFTPTALDPIHYYNTILLIAKKKKKSIYWLTERAPLSFVVVTFRVRVSVGSGMKLSYEKKSILYISIICED